MRSAITGEIIPQGGKPDSKVRMFHGSKNKIVGNKINPTTQSAEDMGWSEGTLNAAFATSDIREAAHYAGPQGHVYEVEEKPNQLETDMSRYGHDHAYNEGAPLTIKQEVGRPGKNILRMQHFATGHNESRK